jgi:hypothetical protein
MCAVTRKRRVLGYIAVPLFFVIVAVKARSSTLLACPIVFISCAGKGALRCKRLNAGFEHEPAAGRFPISTPDRGAMAICLYAVLATRAAAKKCRGRRT